MKIKIGQHQTRAAFEPSSFNEEKRTVDLVWTTGARGKRSSWFGDDYFEELEVSESAVDLSRLNNGAPLLNAHSSYGLNSVIGVVERAWISNGVGHATVRFSEREDVQAIKKDVKDGILRHVSVGYNVQKYEKVAEQDELKVYRATKWTPAEISLVPMGFDDQAVVRGKEEQAFEVEVVEVQTRGMAPHVQEKQMSDGTKETPAPVTVQGPDAETITKAERARAAQIREHVQIAKLDSAVADDLVDRGVSLEDASKAIFVELKKRSDAAPTHNQVRADVQVGRDIGKESLRSGAESALLHRLNPSQFKNDENARRFRGDSLLDIARRFVAATGRSTEGMSKMEIATIGLGMERGGYHSTSDFPLVLADVANKSARRMYDEAPATFAPLARRGTLPDFKPIYRTQLGEAPSLVAVGEGGEFKHGTIGEGREQYQLASYGKVVGFTRKALINDDLGLFETVVSRFGRSARDLESNVVWALITANAAMGDSIALFHASHGNLSSGGAAAISVTSIGAARAAMRIQKGLDGVQLISVAPKYLVVPAAKETIADQFVSQNMLAATNAEKNPFAGRLQVICEPRLDANSTTAWYVFADPSQVDTIEYAYLAGEEAPRIETRVGFDVDGLEIKCAHDFGAKVIDWRGINKNAGA